MHRLWPAFLRGLTLLAACCPLLALGAGDARASGSDPDADAYFVRQIAPDAVERFVAATKAAHPKYAHWPKSQFVNTPPPEFLAIVRQGSGGANAA